MVRRRSWPIVLAVLFVAQLVWFLLYTDQIRRALQSNAQDLSEVFAQIQVGITDLSPGGAEEALMDLQGVIRRAEVPMIHTTPEGEVTAVANLPFHVDVNRPEGQARALEFARRLDLIHEPVGDSVLGFIHFGDPPEVRNLQWIPWLQAGGLLLTAMLGFLFIQIQRKADRERAWTAMARELAHQLGTPISSLQGWLEILRLPGGARPEGVGEGEIAEEIEADLHRLERISRRFELIGREPELEGVDLKETIVSLREYLEARVPRLGSGVELVLEIQPELPAIMGNRVLLTWAFENVVNNALDALGGTGGTIRIRAAEEDGGRVVVSISDTGPGVDPELREDIFEPGVTSKPRGWGVGLALSRRIVEAVHKGRISVEDAEEGGAAFHIRFPPSGEKRSSREEPVSTASEGLS